MNPDAGGDSSWALVDSVNVSEKAFNEDAWGLRGSTFWVIDGATPLSGAPDANKATHDYVEGLSERLWSASVRHQEPREILRLAVASMPSHLLGGHSAAVAIVCGDGDGIRYAILGDCTVVVATDGGVEAVTDARVGASEGEARAEFQRQTAAGLTSSEAFTRITPLLAEQRQKWRNVPGGYWVVIDDASQVADEAACGRVDGAGAGLLATDGFARVDALPDGPDMAEVITACPSLTAVARRMRAWERFASPAGNLPFWPQHDDATAVLVGQEGSRRG